MHLSVVSDWSTDMTVQPDGVATVDTKLSFENAVPSFDGTFTSKMQVPVPSAVKARSEDRACVEEMSAVAVELLCGWSWRKTTASKRASPICSLISSSILESVGSMAMVARPRVRAFSADVPTSAPTQLKPALKSILVNDPSPQPRCRIRSPGCMLSTSVSSMVDLRRGKEQAGACTAPLSNIKLKNSRP